MGFPGGRFDKAEIIGYTYYVSVSKKSFRHAVRILKLSKKVSKSCLIERAVGFWLFAPRTHPPLLCLISLLRGFSTV